MHIYINLSQDRTSVEIINITVPVKCTTSHNVIHKIATVTKIISYVSLFS